MAMAAQSHADWEDSELAVAERKVVGTEDMVMLSGKVTNANIAENLKVRHAADEIYTYIGHVLVVVNPFEWIKKNGVSIYDDVFINRYDGKNRIDVPPHVFAIAEDAFRSMTDEEDSQCIIISGESGAGKTEAAKQVCRYIAAVSGGAGNERINRVKDVVLQSNPLLEAFGNAMTLRNNNSSRFGKYFRLQFDQFGRPQGGVITNYLLEKSRVVRAGKHERSFHVFYQLLAGLGSLPAKTQDKLRLGRGARPEDFAYLKRTGLYEVDNEGGRVDDAKEFEETLAAFKTVGFKNQHRDAVLTTVAAVMHLGNVRFEGARVGDGADGSAVAGRGATEALGTAAKLLGLDAGTLEQHLCYRTLVTMAPGGGVETYEVPLNPVQAAVARDALAKSLYSRMFDHIVSQINKALDVDKVDVDELDPGDELLSIGVLDIYGFEIFDVNAFEQLCINFVNEKLQQIFINLTLKAEQEEYAEEGIKWTPIPFFNNKIVCDLIESRRPPGIFAILDDTCKAVHAEASGVDDKFVDKLNNFHSSHAHYQRSRGGFVVKHYAGDVAYTSNGFCAANKDALLPTVRLMLQRGSSKVVKLLYPEEIDLDDRRAPTTGGYKIKHQCSALVDKLMECTPHYVRCIKSNDQKRKRCFDKRRVVHQVTYLGLMENVKVRRAGFAYRAEFHRFLERFKLLSKKTWPKLWTGSDKDGCKAILKAVDKLVPSLGLRQEVQLGKRKIFIRQPETYFALEALRGTQIDAFAGRIARAWRKFLTRRAFVSLRAEMGKLYNREGKERARASIYRPYDGDYLRDDELRAEMLEIFEFNAKDGGRPPAGGGGGRGGRRGGRGPSQERVVFCDFVRKLEPASGKGAKKGDVALVPRLLALTNRALYLMEDRGAALAEARAKGGAAAAHTGPQRRLHLRRRVPLGDLRGATLTRFGDPFVRVEMQPHMKLAQPDKSNWARDKDVKVCPATGKPFGIFRRRHHCRVTGRVYCKDVCATRLPVPDRGWYKPEKVYDGVVGLSSTELPEDNVLVTDKKSELAAVLRDECQKSGQRRAFAIAFSNEWTLTRAAMPQLSRCPPQPRVAFGGGRVSGTDADRWGGDFAISTAVAGTVSVTVAPGVSDELAKRSARRQEERRRRAEEQRRRENEIRKEQEAGRAAARAEARRQRIARKKAKKKADRERRAGKKATTGRGKGKRGGKSFVTAAARTQEKKKPAWATRKTGGGGGSSSNGGSGGGGWKPKQAVQRAPAPPPAKADPEDVASNWETHETDDGEKYFFNSVTERSSWSKPKCMRAGFGAKAKPPSSSNGGSGGAMRMATAGGNDAASKEMALSDADFQSTFGMSKADFKAKPKWKQVALKKKHGLF